MFKSDGSFQFLNTPDYSLSFSAAVSLDVRVVQWVAARNKKLESLVRIPVGLITFGNNLGEGMHLSTPSIEKSSLYC